MPLQPLKSKRASSESSATGGSLGSTVQSQFHAWLLQFAVSATLVVFGFFKTRPHFPSPYFLPWFEISARTTLSRLGGMPCQVAPHSDGAKEYVKLISAGSSIRNKRRARERGIYITCRSDCMRVNTKRFFSSLLRRFGEPCRALVLRIRRESKYVLDFRGIHVEIRRQIIFGEFQPNTIF